MEADGVLQNIAATAVYTDLRSTVGIVAEGRFLREALAEFVGRDGALFISGLAANLGQALAMGLDQQPDIVLVDAAFPNGADVVGRMRDLAPLIRVIVFNVDETEENIIAWAEAGVTGYIPRTAALADLVAVLRDIMRGEQICSGRVAAGLLRRISSSPRFSYSLNEARSPPTLTPRELQIVKLIGTGMSNKEIARRLEIGVATAKSHVHNLLGKLDLQRRGQVASWIRQYNGRADMPPLPKSSCVHAQLALSLGASLPVPLNLVSSPGRVLLAHKQRHNLDPSGGNTPEAAVRTVMATNVAVAHGHHDRSC